MPVHHIPDDALVGYAAGTSAAGEELLVACHLTWCPHCRAVVERAERVGEVVLDRAPPAPVAAGTLEALLARLDAPVPPPPPRAPCPVFPGPLRDRIGPLASLPWRSLGFDVKAAHVEVDSRERVFLLDFPPGFRIPTHGHDGLERLLVLRGAFRDERDTFGTGDVSWRVDGDHDVTIEDAGRCTTLFVNDGRAEVGWLSPLVDWWLHRS